MKLLTISTLILCSTFSGHNSDISQQIVPDEVSYGIKTAKDEGSKRVSNDDLIRTHHFKLSKGSWNLSYKPEGTLPFVWCSLSYSGTETNDSGREYKSFRGIYSDALNNFEVHLGVFEDGDATIYLTDKKNDTEVVYFLRTDYDSAFMKAVFEKSR